MVSYTFTNLANAGALQAVLLPALLVADVLVVDDDGGAGVDHVQIADAVAAAQQGDTILVKDGTYSGFLIDQKSLVVTADRGATVIVDGSVGVLNLGAAQSVVIHGLRAKANPAPHALFVSGCDGPVWIEDSVFTGSSQPFDLVAKDAAFVFDSTVSIHRCTFQGGDAPGGTNPAGHGLLQSDATVFLFDSSLTGGKAHEQQFGGFLPPANGLTLIDGVAYGTACTLTGGDGGDGFDLGLGCADGGPGGAGLQLLGSTAQATLHDSSATGGPGGLTDPGCQPGPQGRPVDVQTGSLDVVPFSSARISADGPLRVGETLTLELEGIGGTVVFLGVSLGQNPLLLPPIGAGLFPFLGGPRVIDPASSLVFSLGAIPPSGSLDFLVGAIPGTSLELYLQAAVILPSALGDISLTSAQAVTVLDPSL